MPSILIIGCGSIGERHLRCFLSTGRCAVAAVETREELRQAMQERYGVPCHSSIEEALTTGGWDAAVICTPAPLHLPMLQVLLAHGLHVLVEKPLAVDLDAVPATRAALDQHPHHVAVAYVYHLMPWVSAARDYVVTGSLGTVLHATVTAGQHFPTFRPAYREIYYARHEQGGGAVQDALTHLVNAMEWLIGPCTQVYCDGSHQMLEGVTVEDTVNVAARHGVAMVSYAMNQFQAPNETFILLHGTEGSLAIEGHRQRWGVLQRGSSDWTWRTVPPLERDELFIRQAHAFLDGMEGRPSPLCSFEEAVQTLRFNRAALQSIAEGVPVTISQAS
ncbi:MAG: Gfo/Idh/MocA family protein [Verrucomicrobium sp.]